MNTIVAIYLIDRLPIGQASGLDDIPSEVNKCENGVLLPSSQLSDPEIFYLKLPLGQPS